MEGTVKWFSAKKGYGFIETKEGKDVFVHYSAISGEGYKNIDKGDRVTFEIAEAAKGEQAQNVVIVEAAKSKKNK